MTSHYLIIGLAASTLSLFVMLSLEMLLATSYSRLSAQHRMGKAFLRQVQGGSREKTSALGLFISEFSRFKALKKFGEFTLKLNMLRRDEIRDLEQYLKHKYGIDFADLVSIVTLSLVSVSFLTFGLSALFASSKFWILAVAIPALGLLIFLKASKTLVKRFRLRIESDLAEYLTMMSLLTLAGTPFNRAMDEYYASSFSLLAELSYKHWSEHQAGIRTRSQLLERMSKLAEAEAVQKVFRSLQHSLELGSPLSLVIDSHLEELKENQKKRVEEEISQIPVKILIPLGLCILPAMLILLLGPILVEVLLGISM